MPRDDRLIREAADIEGEIGAALALAPERYSGLRRRLAAGTALITNAPVPRRPDPIDADGYFVSQAGFRYTSTLRPSYRKHMGPDRHHHRRKPRTHNRRPPGSDRPAVRGAARLGGRLGRAMGLPPFRGAAQRKRHRHELAILALPVCDGIGAAPALALTIAMFRLREEAPV
jgi:hypothetical protein